MTTPTPSDYWINECIKIAASAGNLDAAENARRDLAALKAELASVKAERDSLKAFRNYFADKCEGLFFQFGMEVIDLYNATHGYKACHIEPDRAANPKDAP